MTQLFYSLLLYPRQINTCVSQTSSMIMLMTAQFLIAPQRKQFSCPSKEEYVNTQSCDSSMG